MENSWLKKKNKQYIALNKHLSAFTLTELIIVIAMIAFLVLVGVMYLRSQIHKANDAKRKADIRKILTAVEEYEKDNDCYPQPDLLGCEPGKGLMPYLDKIPCDPVTGESYLYEVDGPTCANWFRMFSELTYGGDPVGPNGDYNYSASSPNAPEPNLYASSFYGCKSGSCVKIRWNVSIPGVECNPSYGRSDCYGNCRNESGQPVNECITRR